MRRIGRKAIPMVLSVLACPGCVVAPTLPGVVEPGAAVRARLEPAAAVTVVEDGRSARVRWLIGRVETVDSAGYLLLVRSAERADGGRARELEGRRVRIPRSVRPEMTILAGDARASEVATFALIGAITVAVFAFLHAALGGG